MESLSLWPDTEKASIASGSSESDVNGWDNEQ